MTEALTVVKLGGSHALSPLLGDWLRALCRQAGHIVVVPGGGPFADAVRTAQAPMGFDDDAAHDMALMAMAQYGRALASLAEVFAAAEDIAAIGAALELGKIPVWSPWPMLRAHPDIPRSWDLTSDSLAIWLAREVRAREVVLIKHRAARPGASLTELAADGLVDPCVPRFAARFVGRVRIVGPDDIPHETAA